MFDAEQGTPIEAFYLETSVWLLRYILIARKLMYYWKILRKSEKELVKKVFNAQSAFPTKGDWVTGIKDILFTLSRGPAYRLPMPLFIFQFKLLRQAFNY